MSGSPPVAAWPAGWRPSRGDLALAVLVGLVGLQGASDADGVKDPAWAVIGLIECTALPLAWRSLWPLPVLGVTLTAAVAGDLLFDGLQFAGPVIALYTVARHHARGGESALRDRDLPRPRGGVGDRGQRAQAARVSDACAGLGSGDREGATGAGAGGRCRGAGADRARAARRDLAQRERDGAASRGGRRRVRDPS